jgi:hypothetical protein
MINGVIRFILSVTGIDIKLLCLPASPEQMEMQELNFCESQNKIAGSQYNKRFTIWELGKNKFT